MPFYAYIVRCSDASYYTGHTDDLEKRISDHNLGGLSAYTTFRLVVNYGRRRAYFNSRPFVKGF